MSRPHLWRWLETAFAVAFPVAIAISPGSRAFLRAWSAVALEQVRVLGPLLSVDGAATAACLLRLVARLGLAMLPSLFLLRRSPWRRRVWLGALLMMVVVFASPISLASCATVAGWLLLLALSLGATLLVQRRRWGAFAVGLPFLVLLQALPRHLLPARRSVDPNARERMLAACRSQGHRPSNLTPERVKPAHAVSALDDDLLLLTGQGSQDDVMFGLPDPRPGSWWLRRQDGQLVFDRPSAAEGRFWRACLLDGALWMTQEGRMIRARRSSDGDEDLLRLRVPSRDLDVGDTACEPRRHRVYVGEATLGGLWELNPDDQRFRRHEIGLPALLPRGRFDGKVVVSSSARLNVVDDGRVVERTASALLSVGFDVCSRDGAAAVGDATGRLRVFTLDNGHYRFAWALPLFAPRRATWSRDCSRIAVTSIDDHSVFIVDAAAHRLLETFQAGPALREVTATAPREFSIADACAVTSYRW